MEREMARHTSRGMMREKKDVCTKVTNVVKERDVQMWHRFEQFRRQLDTDGATADDADG